MIVTSMTLCKRSTTFSFTQQPTLTFKAEKFIECVVIELPTGVTVVIQSLTLFGCGIKSEPVGVVHWLFVRVRRSDDFYICATPIFGNKDMCAVAGGFHFALDDFVAFDFVSIHQLCYTMLKHKCIDSRGCGCQQNSVCKR